MQSKERKWHDIEVIMEEYIEDDDELRDKFRELRINVRASQRISNVVTENERLEHQCRKFQKEIKRLRSLLLNPRVKYDRVDDRILKSNMKDISRIPLSSN